MTNDVGAARWRTTVPGFPRLGPDREYKRALERFWKGAITEAEFLQDMESLHRSRLLTMADAGLSLVPCGDFSWYDHILDTSLMLGCVPGRFGLDPAAITPADYFALARGRDGIAALEMTKWFDTNYHYLVPEMPASFSLHPEPVMAAYALGREVCGDRAMPAIIGPFTFLRLARLRGQALADRLGELAPLYVDLLRMLADAGAEVVQVGEPSLVEDMDDIEFAAFMDAWRSIAGVHPGVILATWYGDVADHLPELLKLPVYGIALDLARGREANMVTLRRCGVPEQMTVVAGLVNGRNIWRTDLDAAAAIARELAGLASPDRVLVGASCPLWHLPETVNGESSKLQRRLRFARERLGEIALLSNELRWCEDDSVCTVQWMNAMTERERWLADPQRHRPHVKERIDSLDQAAGDRGDYGERVKLHRAHLDLPLFPTTTIGSFPQTTELRQARAAAARDLEAYDSAMRDEIARVVALQEEIGLDVLVHGEPERNDMVQFFAEQLDGYLALPRGWVQSYGSRCVRPPVIDGDIHRSRPMTVAESAYAQSLTSKPVKGMLTGPVTMLRWSFVRDDISQETVAMQLALAIRDEVADLESAGIRVIQVDEPAIREGLPLRRRDHPDYLRWAVAAFRVAAAGASPAVQLHTHMCYSDFGDILDAIIAMDADVLSIEDARSDGLSLLALRDHGYGNQVGPGVYDVHSPAVPGVTEMVAKLRSAAVALPAEQLWVNPDCGLKTRGYVEVVPALKAMVAAARQVRQEVAG